MPQANWRIGLAIAVLLGTGVAVRDGWRHTSTGQLAWNGESWRWESSDYQAGIAAEEISVIADCQLALLLRLENQNGAGLWLWLEKRAMPDRWMDLRRAVYSPHRSPLAGRHDLPPKAPPAKVYSAGIPRIKT